MSKLDHSHLQTMRHSTAHLLASAVQKLYPKVKLGIGPAIENGFYYDFGFGSERISEEDLLRIEEKMREIQSRGDLFKKQELSVEEAKKIFNDQPYKLELIEAIVKGELKDPSTDTHTEVKNALVPEEQANDQNATLSVYHHADFTDLCRGPHFRSTAEIGPFKLLSVAGAYWRGKETNPMLTRIYGTAFVTQDELDQYLLSLEEAKKRDHRKIGHELEIFILSDHVGAGLPLWLPNGTIIKEELENWAKETERQWGYLRVRTPHIGKKILYETSGHLPYYDEDMYPPLTDEEGTTYYLKPMNCPHHHMIYQSRIRSYKELPLRLAEYGEVYRYEKSGELHGLMRVRFISQNDAHIYCTQNQAQAEFQKVIQLHQYYYQKLGLKDFYMELALRDPHNQEKYHGDETMWQKAEKLTRAAMKESGVNYVEKEGEAAFYGPKVDFNIKSVTGKIFGASTNQLDLFMADRFKLSYIGEDGKEHTPVIIHRAPLGSSERLVGFLIEHFAGAFPVWLHPTQVVIIPVSEQQNAYSLKIHQSIIDQIPQARVKIDRENATLPKKIHAAQLSRIPYMLVVGKQEEKNQTVNLRLRTEETLGEVKVDEFIERLSNKIRMKELEIWSPTGRARGT